jgi:hypothetical protein
MVRGLLGYFAANPLSGRRNVAFFAVLAVAIEKSIDIVMLFLVNFSHIPRALSCPAVCLR